MKPANESARAGMFILSEGNGFNRLMAPHSVAWVWPIRPRMPLPSHPGSIAWRRYQGNASNHVNGVAERPTRSRSTS